MELLSQKNSFTLHPGDVLMEALLTVGHLTLGAVLVVWQSLMFEIRQGEEQL